MAKEETIVTGMAGRYAQALFELAQERHVTETVAADLCSFQELLAENRDLQRLIKSPVFSAEAQVKALTAVLDRAGIGGLAANFIKLVATKRRLFAIADMIAGFHRLNDAFKGVVRAEVTVAEPLSDAHLSALKTALAESSGSNLVDVAVKIDPSIIGGLVVKLGSRMVDSSLKTKLDALSSRMKEVG